MAPRRGSWTQVAADASGPADTTAAFLGFETASTGHFAAVDGTAAHTTTDGGKTWRSAPVR